MKGLEERPFSRDLGVPPYKAAPPVSIFDEGDGLCLSKLLNYGGGKCIHLTQG